MTSRIIEKRNEYLLKKLNLKRQRTQKKKFIVMQIDGLSYDILKKAMQKGHVKFLKTLVEKEENYLTHYNCGLPSGTPAIQAAIMYGDNKNIPAFRFIDKKRKRYYNFANPRSVREVWREFYKDKKGIVEGGSSYGNHLSGGAKRSIFTMNTVTEKKRLKRVKESSIWLVVLLNPYSLLRVLYYTMSELTIETASFVWNLLTKWFTKKNGIYNVWLPFRRLFMEVIFSELVTKAAILDIKRGVPRIYLTFLNYDDISHVRGPESLEAYFVLRGVDRRVKRIYKEAEKEGYDIYILSDHGQMPAVPFRIMNNMELSKFIEKCANVKSFGTEEHVRRASLFKAALLKLVYSVHHLSAPLRWVVKIFVKSTLKVLRKKKYPFDWENKNSIFAVDSCNLASVYFNFSDEPVTIEQIERKFPKLLDKLIRNKGIGVIMGRTKDSILLLGKNGKIKIRPDGNMKKTGKEFLKKFGNPEILIKQLKELASKNFQGDLVLFGNINNGFSTSFTDHVGAHGGIGAPAMKPFFISKYHPDLTHITDAKEIHKLFTKYA